MEIETLDGKENIKISPSTQTDTIIKVKGKKPFKACVTSPFPEYYGKTVREDDETAFQSHEIIEEGFAVAKRDGYVLDYMYCHCPKKDIFDAFDLALKNSMRFSHYEYFYDQELTKKITDTDSTNPFTEEEFIKGKEK